MSKNYYILKDGHLIEQEGVFRFDSREEFKRLPVEDVTSITLMGGGTISTGALKLAGKFNIPIHVLGYYGDYIGTFWPKEHYFSGDLTIKQAEVFLNYKRRLELSISLVNGIYENMKMVLKKYGGNYENLTLRGSSSSIEELMLNEARLRKDYYIELDRLLPEDFMIITREKHPPTNYGNSLISLGNTLLYTEIVTQARKVSLNPSIPFYHSPQSGRFSLAFDLSEPLKPPLVDRLILQVTKQGIIRPLDEHFRNEGNGILLNEKGKKIFITEWEKWLDSSSYNERLSRNVSNREKIRFELHKYVKDIEGIEKYKPSILGGK